MPEKKTKSINNVELSVIFERKLYRKPLNNKSDLWSKT